MAKAAFTGAQLLEDAAGNLIERYISAQDATSLPRRGARYTLDGRDLWVRDYVPQTVVVEEIVLDRWSRAMIRYCLASGEWGWMIYQWVDHQPRLRERWRDGYASYQDALDAALAHG